MKKRTIEWAEGHQREAARLLCRIGENAAARGDFSACDVATERIARTVATEAALRERLAMLLDAKVIDREVRRVDKLARGVLVREPSERFEVRRPAFGLAHAWPAESIEFDTWEEAKGWAHERNEQSDAMGTKTPRRRPVRVRITRILRASR